MPQTRRFIDRIRRNAAFKQNAIRYFPNSESFHEQYAEWLEQYNADIRLSSQIPFVPRENPALEVPEQLKATFQTLGLTTEEQQLAHVQALAAKGISFWGGTHVANLTGFENLPPLIKKIKSPKTGRSLPDIVRYYSQQHDIPQSLIYSFISTESSFNPNAMGDTTLASGPSVGLLQILRTTAEELEQKKIPVYSRTLADGKVETVPFVASERADPEVNIAAGTALLASHLASFKKDFPNASEEEVAVELIASHNAGAGFSRRRLKRTEQTKQIQDNTVNAYYVAGVLQREALLRKELKDAHIITQDDITRDKKGIFSQALLTPQEAPILSGLEDPKPILMRTGPLVENLENVGPQRALVDKTQHIQEVQVEIDPRTNDPIDTVHVTNDDNALLIPPTEFLKDQGTPVIEESPLLAAIPLRPKETTDTPQDIPPERTPDINIFNLSEVVDNLPKKAITKDILARLSPPKRFQIALKYGIDVSLPSPDLVHIKGTTNKIEAPDLRLDPDVAARFEKARQKAEKLDIPIIINSAYRDPAQQAVQFKSGAGIRTSWHMSGRALDISTRSLNADQRTQLNKLLKEQGFEQAVAEGKIETTGGKTKTVITSFSTAEKGFTAFKGTPDETVVPPGFQNTENVTRFHFERNYPGLSVVKSAERFKDIKQVKTSDVTHVDNTDTDFEEQLAAILSAPELNLPDRPTDFHYEGPAPVMGIPKDQIPQPTEISETAPEPPPELREYRYPPFNRMRAEQIPEVIVGTTKELSQKVRSRLEKELGKSVAPADTTHIAEVGRDQTLRKQIVETLSQTIRSQLEKELEKSATADTTHITEQMAPEAIAGEQPTQSLPTETKPNIEQIEKNPTYQRIDFDENGIPIFALNEITTTSIDPDEVKRRRSELPPGQFNEGIRTLEGELAPITDVPRPPLPGPDLQEARHMAAEFMDEQNRKDAERFKKIQEAVSETASAKPPEKVETIPLSTDPSPYKVPDRPKLIPLTTNSYAGSDIRVLINTADRVYKIGNLQTISYSIHRDKMPVRTLGRTYAKGYVRGTRTVAGSMVFTIFDRHALWEILRYHARDLPENPAFTPLSDMLPPFDITIVFDNEYGAQSVMRLYGLEVIDEGQTMSIDDMITENVMSYAARNIELMSTSRNSAYGPEGKVFANSGIFIKGQVPEIVSDEIQKILNEIAQAKLELVGGPYRNNIPNAARANELQNKIKLLENMLKDPMLASHLRIQGVSDIEDVNRYNIPWDFKTRRNIQPSPTRSHATDDIGPGGGSGNSQLNYAIPGSS